MAWSIIRMDAMRLATTQASGSMSEKESIVKKVESTLSDYLGSSFDGEKYSAEITIKQGGKTNFIFALYCVVDGTINKSKEINVIDVKESDYAYAELPEDNDNEAFTKRLADGLKEFLSDKKFAQDMSKILYLEQVKDGMRCIYIPLRKK